MPDRVGQQLGNYRLTSLLGQGGFAEVYLGEHIYLKTQTAVKILQTRLSSSEDMEGFLKEAQTVARLTHPNIVRILDFGVEGETPFLVMDYALNGTLRQRHKRGELLSLLTVASYVRQIAEALQHAHDERLIHRDVKPENMLVSRRNEILLSDFGIALVAQSSRYQSTQDVVGTVAYMSPEQIQGKPRPASDQYSLGIVVYEWLSGERPFSGSFTELCTQHLFAPVPPLRVKVPAIVPEVEQVVTTALAKDPKDRFGNMRAFATALEHAARLIPNPAQTPYLLSPLPQTELAQPQPEHAPATLQALQQGGSPAATLPTPSYPPTQFAGSSTATSLSPYSPMTNDGNIRYPSPASTPSGGSGWRLGKQQLIAMAVGVVVFGVIQFVNFRFIPNLSNGSVLFQHIGDSLYLPSLYNILLGFAMGVPFFFGAKFGPWVGLVIGFVPTAVHILFYPHSLGTLATSWYDYATSASDCCFYGFIPGLAFVITKHRHSANGASTISTAILMSTIASLIGTVFDVVIFSINYHRDYPVVNLFFSNLSSVFLSYICGLILLLVLLLLYEKIAGNRVRFF